MFRLLSNSKQGDRTFWCPWPLRTYFLAVFCFMCCALAIGIEFIIRGCSGGCHVFNRALSATEMSPANYFVYNSLPAIVTLVLSLLWGVIHHDVLRMEPYYQMSAPGGASAANSLFLQYPYVFPMFVPIEASRRRHFVVLISSIILIITTMFIVPLTSGIFDDAPVTVSSVDSATRAKIQSSEWLAANLGGGFSHKTYSYAWLNGSLPAFTTAEYALLPVKSNASISKGGETWEAETILYEADLICEGATVEVDWSNDYPIFTANATERNFTTLNRANSYSPEGRPVWSSLANLFLNSTSEQSYFYAWTSGELTRGNLTLPPNTSGKLCNTSYHSQSVIANFSMPSGKVENITRTGPRIKFNDTNLLGGVLDGWSRITIPSRYVDSEGAFVGLGYAPNNLANPETQLVRRFGSGYDLPGVLTTCAYRGRPYCPSRSTVLMDRLMSLEGLSLFKQTKETLEDMLDPEVLGEAYRRALKLVFAMAVSSEMVDPDTQETVSVTRSVVVKGFNVNNLWARGAQGGLGAVALLTVLMAVMNSRRRCNLDGEPNSMAAALRLLWASPEFSNELEQSEFHKLKPLLKRLDGYDAVGAGPAPVDVGGPRRYALEVVPGQGPKVNVIGGSKPVDTTPPIDPMQLTSWKKDLWQLRAVSGISLVVFFVVILALITTAFIYSRLPNGLRVTPDRNSAGYKILYSYIPIALGMTVEPFLVAIASCHYMIAPYRALIRGHASSSESIGVDYDKSPPHFQLFRAIRGRHIGLALLTISILLSNVLAVALAGLFSPTTIDIRVETQVMTPVSPKIDGQFTVPAYEMYYTLLGNLSSDVAPPNWTTSDYYILPFSPSEDEDIDQYEGPTIGIGAYINCSFVPEESISTKCTGERCINRKAGRTASYLDILIDDECWPHQNLDWTSYSNITKIKDTIQWDRSSDHFARSVGCPDTFFLLWTNMPANPNPGPNMNTTAYFNRVESVAIKCSSTAKVTELTAVVSGNGQVLSAVEDRVLSAQEIEDLYTDKDIATHLVPSFLDTMHNGIMDNDGTENHQIMWLDYAMATLDPSIVQNKTNLTHIPDKTHLIETFETVFRDIFAINLRLYADDILSVGGVQNASGAALTPREAVSVNYIMFSLASAIILYTIIAVVIVYWGKVPALPCHLPYSLIGTYALLYASNAKQECGMVQGKPGQRAEGLKSLGRVYTFGEFNGDDGRYHVGVYRESVCEESEELSRRIVLFEERRNT